MFLFPHEMLFCLVFFRFFQNSSSAIPSGSISSDAVYLVGKGQSSESGFTGCIQDITVYPQVLEKE